MGKEIWWEYVKKIIRQYPELKKELEEIKEPSMSITYGKIGAASGVIWKPTENAALLELSPQKQKRLNAIESAIKSTKILHQNDFDLRIMVIDLVYWSRTHTLTGAAMRVPCHLNTASCWQAEFIRLVAEGLDLE